MNKSLTSIAPVHWTLSAHYSSIGGKPMKAYLARALVRWISGWYQTSYDLYWIDFWQLDVITGRLASALERRILPLASSLDSYATGDQMVEECWWG